MAATHVPTASRRGFHGPWVALLAALVLVVAVGGVAFAFGRNSAPTPSPTNVAQANLGPQVTHMMPWMQTHVDDIAWMQNHMSDVAWMRGHWSQWQWMHGHVGNVASMRAHPSQWQWMQMHPTQWRWMQSHMRDIGWMHDHWAQWHGWQASTGYRAGTGSNGNGTDGLRAVVLAR